MIDDKIITTKCEAVCVDEPTDISCAYGTFIYIGTNTKPVEFIEIDLISRSTKIIAKSGEKEGYCKSLRFKNDCLYAILENGVYLRIDLTSKNVTDISHEEYSKSIKYISKRFLSEECSNLIETTEKGKIVNSLYHVGLPMIITYTILYCICYFINSPMWIALSGALICGALNTLKWIIKIPVLQDEIKEI